MLDYAKASEGEGGDYIIDKQTLHLSKSFLTESNIADLYIKSVVENLKEYSELYKILNEKSRIDYLMTNLDEKQKDINEIYKYLSEKLESNRFKSGYVILSNKGLLSVNMEDLLKKFKEEADLILKYEIYKEIYELISISEISEVLHFKDLMYGRINMFLSGTSLWFGSSNVKKDIFQLYDEEFVYPLLESLEGIKKAKKNSTHCIECFNEMPKQGKPTSFMIDTTDDVGKKKGYYWNLKPDAYVCPLCAFIYSFVPIGFAFLGQDAVFINNNADIESMRKLMNTYINKAEDELKDDKRAANSRLYRPFIKIKSDMLENKVGNVQVIVKKRNNNYYGMNIVDKSFVSKLYDASEYLEKIEKLPSIKIGKDDYVNRYDEVFENLLYGRNQYNLINKFLKYHLGNGGSVNYLMNVLKTQITFWGGDKMDDMQKTVNTAWAIGKEMRNVLADDAAEKDKDNKLRGFVYQLSNALTVGNREQYMNLIIRAYTSKGKPIPYIFTNCFESDELFNCIGYGFVLGIKADDFSKSNNNNENENKTQEAVVNE